MQGYKLPRMTLALAYILCYLSTMQLQLQKIEKSPKRVSADSNVLLKNIEDWVQLEQLIIRLAKYNISTRLIYKYFRKEKLRDFRVQS